MLELATAAKPALLAHLLEDGGTATYLDPDIKVYAPLGDALTAAAEAGIALTPHCLHPVPRDGLETSERTIRLAGTFNLGFVSVGQRARPFLRWWHERLRHEAVVDVADGLFTDQRWVDWVPSLFEHTVLRDPGLNVAYWNAHERDVRRDEDGRLLAGPGPLRFFHFSGYDPATPEHLSRYALPRPRVRLADSPVLADVCADYAADLARQDHATCRLAPYGLGRLGDGRTLSPRVRRLVRLAAADGDPGAVRLRPHADPAGLTEWLAEPLRGPAGARLRRWDLAVWAERPDLQAGFPDLDAGSARPFLHWLRQDPWAQAERRADGVPDVRVPRPGRTAAGPQRHRVERARVRRCRARGRRGRPAAGPGGAAGRPADRGRRGRGPPVAAAAPRAAGSCGRRRPSRTPSRAPTATSWLASGSRPAWPRATRPGSGSGCGSGRSTSCRRRGDPAWTSWTRCGSPAR